MTLKTGLRFAQGHWKWHHLIDRMHTSILFAFHSNYGDILYSHLLVENREIFIAPRVFSVPQGVTQSPSEFREDV